MANPTVPAPGARRALGAACRRLLPTRGAAAIALSVCIAAPAALAGLQIDAQPKLSPLDEPAHFDYVNRVAAGELPRQGQRLRADTLRTMACRRFAIETPVPPCGQQRLHPDQFPGGGWQYEAQQPPTYYALTGAMRWLAQHGLRIGDRMDATRVASTVWLIAGLVLLWSAGRVMRIDPRALGAALLLLVVAPSIVFLHATVSNDATAVAAAGVVALVAALAERRRPSSMAPWLFAAGFFAAACKSTNLLAVGAVAASFAVGAVCRRGLGEAWSTTARRWAGDGGALLAGGLVATVTWVLLHRSLSLIDLKEEPTFATLRSSPHGLGVILRESANLLHPITGEIAVSLSSAATLGQPVQELLSAVLSYLLIGAGVAGLFVPRRRWPHVVGLVAVPLLPLGGIALGIAIVRTYGIAPGLSGRYGMSLAPLLVLALAASLEGRWTVRAVGLLGVASFVTTLVVMTT